MGILADWQIERDVKITPFAKYDRQKQLGKISWGCGSYGYDARIGYKFRVFKPFLPTGEVPVIDPLNFNPQLLEEVNYSPHKHDWQELRKNAEWRCKRCGRHSEDPDRSDHYYGCQSVPNHIVIPPHSFVLGETVEHFDIPRDVLCVVVGKSTYARCGLVVNVTPGEPEWKGRWTVEVSNTTPLPAKVYCGQGIMQCMFFRSDGYRELPNSFRVMPYNHPDVITKASCGVSYADKRGKYQDQAGLTNPTVTKEDGK